MKKSKLLLKIFTTLLSLAMVFTFMPAAMAAEYDSSDATAFVFSDSGITVREGKYGEYKIDGTALTISGSGVYIFSGECTNGSIKIKKNVTGVTVVLNGLTLTATDTAPITCGKSSEATIIAASGTVNTLNDSALNNDDEHPENENAENAVIKCKDGSKITICGGGTLDINAFGKNGIKSGASTDSEGEAQMIIKDITLNINANVNDGINAEAILAVLSGNITVDASNDGIHSDYVLNIGAADSQGPAVNITNCYEGLEAAQFNIYSGNIKIRSENDCLNAANSDISNYNFEINIYGGTLDMFTSNGDGIDSNGSITISGGTTSVWSANSADNQPFDADGSITISDGTVIAAGGSAGMGMNISNGQAYITFGSGFMGGGMGPREEMPWSGGQPNAEKNNSNQSDNNGTLNLAAPQKPNGQPDMRPGGQTSLGITKGTEITIKDSEGNVIYSGTALCDAGFLIYSSPELTTGNDYSLYSGNSSIGSSTAQSSSQGSNKPSIPSDKPPLDPPSEPEQTPASSEQPQNTASPSDENSTHNLPYIIIIAVFCIIIVILAIALVRTKKSHKHN